jgi:hypothetical protein
VEAAQKTGWGLATEGRQIINDEFAYSSIHYLFYG